MENKNDGTVIEHYNEFFDPILNFINKIREDETEEHRNMRMRYEKNLYEMIFNKVVGYE